MAKDTPLFIVEIIVPIIPNSITYIEYTLTVFNPHTIVIISTSVFSKINPDI